MKVFYAQNESAKEMPLVKGGKNKNSKYLVFREARIDYSELQQVKH
jgi:hypothetical protein